MLHGLKQGNEVLKEIHKEMNIESVEKLLDETAEARAYQQVRLSSSAPFRSFTPSTAAYPDTYNPSTTSSSLQRGFRCIRC